MVKQVDHERLVASVPVNKQASLVTSKGFQYTPSKIVNALEWETPPPLKRPAIHQRDLTGTRVGRLVVIGVLDMPKTSKHNRASWACRCDCGRYVHRSAKALNNPDNSGDRCQQCRHVEFLRTRHLRLEPKRPQW